MYYTGDNPWIHCDVLKKECYDEMITAAAQFYRGTDWFIELCTFINSTTLVDVSSSYGELYCSLYPVTSVASGSRIFKLTIDTAGTDEGKIYTDCTLADWVARTKKQAEFKVVDSKTGGSALAAGTYTMVFHGVNTDSTKKFVLGKMNITVIEAGL